MLQNQSSRNFVLTFFILYFLFLLSSCGITRNISGSAEKLIIKDSSIGAAHIGICIYEPSTRKYWYNYQADHYFVPASNTKIPTCYAAMKYLGDSLAGIHIAENDTAIFIWPTADPTLLHPDFSHHPVVDYLKNSKKRIYLTDIGWRTEALGSGWSWNDYNESFMAERSPLPIYGNLIKWTQEEEYDEPAIIYSLPEVNWKVDFDTTKSNNFSVRRNLAENAYRITEGREKLRELSVPFVTNGISTALELLPDTIHERINLVPGSLIEKWVHNGRLDEKEVFSQPTDSVLKLMIHNSDNFFAEQILLMVSNRLLKVMNDKKIIDTLLKTDFKDLPQKPRWADGSGLSRYNLFSPRDFTFILEKMKKEYGIERIRLIFPTGNEGTLKNYYRADSGYIFAKTGTLSGVVSLSGFLYTRKNKLLIFSVLVNNHTTSATVVRRSVEKFLQNIREKY